ncbi:MAG TPA: hypothetical protein VGH38_26985 [Bryobacteraceae bacterium]|jgi:hypothetical protein
MVSYSRISKAASTTTADSQPLQNVVDHYNTCMSLRLAPSEESDLIHYLLSLTFGPQH